jgi:hypothetical protein
MKKLKAQKNEKNRIKCRPHGSGRLGGFGFGRWLANGSRV